jgi:hypothetical protein
MGKGNDEVFGAAHCYVERMDAGGGNVFTKKRKESSLHVQRIWSPLATPSPPPVVPVVKLYARPHVTAAAPPKSKKPKQKNQMFFWEDLFSRIKQKIRRSAGGATNDKPTAPPSTITLFLFLPPNHPHADPPTQMSCICAPGREGRQSKEEALSLGSPTRRHAWQESQGEGQQGEEEGAGGGRVFPSSSSCSSSPPPPLEGRVGAGGGKV